MGYITTRDDTKLYVKDWGRGRPVILMHGWPLSAGSWDDQAVTIAEAVLVSSVAPYMLQTAKSPEGVPQAKFDQRTERHEA